MEEKDNQISLEIRETFLEEVTRQKDSQKINREGASVAGGKGGEEGRA